MSIHSNQLEETLALLEQAADANQRTPGRSGNVVQIDSALSDDVLITGDLHGNRESFERILSMARLDPNPRRHLVLQEICHGGPRYRASGGCMSHTLLEDVARLKVQYPDRVHLLLGNHELAELVDYPIQKQHRSLNLAFSTGLRECYGEAADQVRRHYLAFLGTCPLAVRIGAGVFVSHSLPEFADVRPFDVGVFSRPLTPVDCVPRSPAFQLVWGRDYREENVKAFAALVDARVFINGHEPCLDGFWVPNAMQIVLDSCCERPCCLLVPAHGELTHAEIRERITPVP